MARLIQRCSLTLRDFGRQNGWPARDRDQFVGLQILFTLSRGKGGPYEMRGRVQGPTLMTDDVVLNIEVKFGFPSVPLGKVDFVSIL